MYLGYNEIDLVLQELSNNELANLCGLISNIIGADEDINKFRFVKKDLLIQFCSKHLDELLNNIIKHAS